MKIRKQITPYLKQKTQSFAPYLKQKTRNFTPYLKQSTIFAENIKNCV